MCGEQPDPTWAGSRYHDFPGCYWGGGRGVWGAFPICRLEMSIVDVAGL